MKLRDLTGQKFGKLTVIKRSDRKDHVYWICQCDCGNIKEVLSGNLTMGYTVSCGCYGAEQRRKSRTSHGGYGTRLYHIWASMKDRCFNRNCTPYMNYGGRGITVCDEWKESFINFREWAYKNGYKDDLTIDRIDNNGNYEPKNCRWVSRKVQNNNTRANVYITIDGETKTMSQWCEEKGLDYNTIIKRRYHGWSDVDAITKPIQIEKRCKRYGIS